MALRLCTFEVWNSGAQLKFGVGLRDGAPFFKVDPGHLAGTRVYRPHYQRWAVCGATSGPCLLMPRSLTNH